MQFQFDGNQKHQTDAIRAAVELFDGQPRLKPDFSSQWFGGVNMWGPVANRLDLDEARILENVQAVQRRYGIEPSIQLELIRETIRVSDGEKEVAFPNFSVEMETGTGKTYVYLRTALELYRRYGLGKFVIVVPSVAVREGVLKTLRMTESHLRTLYGNTPYRFTVYDSRQLNRVRDFAQSAETVEILVMTIDSFNKEDNVIRQKRDNFQGQAAIYLLQAARPILILDEPQNMESEQRINALATLDPLFALRYSGCGRARSHPVRLQVSWK